MSVPNPAAVAHAPAAAERRLLLLLAALQFTHLLDYMVLMPLGAEVMQAFGVSASQFGLLVGLYTLASASAALLGGGLLDRGDRKRVLLLLYAGFVLATVACALAPTFATLLAARAAAGACAGLMTAAVMAIIADRVPPPRRGAAIGTVMSAFAVCAVIGVPTGLWLAAQGSWRTPFLAVAALAALLWLILLRQLPATPPDVQAPQSRYVDIVARPGLALGWLLTFGIVFSGFLIVPYLGAHLNGALGVALADLSWIYLAAGVATFFAVRVIGRAADRYGAVRVLALLMLLSIVPHLWLTHLQPGSLPLITAVFVLFMVVTSTRAIPALAWLIGRVPPPLRGRYLAVNMASSDAASGLGAWTAGLLIGSGTGGALSDFGRVGWLAVGVTIATLWLLWYLRSRDVAITAAEPSPRLNQGIG
ncbi:MAG: MFS transporter [Pseudomonadota bacterium]|nr:MFS transporter [Pseudomonadota bacterium]